MEGEERLEVAKQGMWKALGGGGRRESMILSGSTELAKLYCPIVRVNIY